MKLMNLILQSKVTNETATMTVEVDCDMLSFFEKVDKVTQGQVRGLLMPLPQRYRPFKWEGPLLSRFF